MKKIQEWENQMMVLSDCCQNGSISNIKQEKLIYLR
jgi:hypothetical protein